MNTQRLIEIYSYYIDDCYEDDYSGKFLIWLMETNYWNEVNQWFNELYERANNE